jgi:hypothetical protein
VKIILIFVFAIFASSCKTRSVELTKDKIKYLDKSIIERNAPADRVYITIPATPNERPVSQTKSYKGNKGAITDVVFNEKGEVTTIISDCPQVNEKEQRDIAYERNLKLKNIDHTFNLEAGKMMSKTIIWCFGLISLAWVGRAFVFRR